MKQVIKVKEPRTDKRRNIDKIASALVVDPLATTREIEEMTWVSKSTVATHKANLDKIGQKDPRIVALTDKDLEIVTKAQEIINNKLNDEELVKTMNIRDISTVAKDSSARYSIFRWDITDTMWWLKADDFARMSVEDLLKFLK